MAGRSRPFGAGSAQPGKAGTALANGGVQGSPTLNGSSLPAGMPSSAIESSMATVT
jgi:hypothetical protein